MRHRALQNGRKPGSVGRRRQYTQRGSDGAKPAHCINGRPNPGNTADGDGFRSREADSAVSAQAPTSPAWWRTSFADTMKMTSSATLVA